MYMYLFPVSIQADVEDCTFTMNTTIYPGFATQLAGLWLQTVNRFIWGHFCTSLLHIRTLASFINVTRFLTILVHRKPFRKMAFRQEKQKN